MASWRGKRPRKKLNHTDIALLIDQLYGPLFYRTLVTGEPTDADFVRRHLAALLPVPEALRPPG